MTGVMMMALILAIGILIGLVVNLLLESAFERHDRRYHGLAPAAEELHSGEKLPAPAVVEPAEMDVQKIQADERRRLLLEYPELAEPVDMRDIHF